MSRYSSSGHGYLVCPRLLELDERHAEPWETWDPCRRGEQCPIKHRHEAPLRDLEGHTVAHFHWVAGSLHADEHGPELDCRCGHRLVHGALDDPWA